MNLRNITKKIAVAAAATLSVGFLATGCTALGIDPLAGTPFGNQGGTTNVLGVNPAGAPGQFAVSSLGGLDSPRTAETNADEPGGDLTVEVKNSDGTFSACTQTAGEEVAGSDFNSLAVVIDDSGSMERTYPENEFGDICLTCPHDPQRRRVAASERLIQTIMEKAPASRIGVMDFGPTATEGFGATRLLAPFTDNAGEAIDALGLIDGGQMVGTPLYDSLAEIIGVTDDDAESYEDLLRTEIETKGTLPTGMGGTEEPATEAPPVQRVLVVLSDGDDRDSIDHNLGSVIDLAQAEGVRIYAIGLGPASASFDDVRLQTDEQVSAVTNLQRLASETGGFYASVHDADALEELFGLVATSLADGYAVDTVECLPDGEQPETGEKVEGRVVDEQGNVVNTFTTYAE